MWNNGRRAAVPSGDRTSVNIVEYPVSDESCKQEANGVRWWIVMIAAFAAGGGHARTAASTPAYPERPVRFIVPLAPGGSVDIMARSVAEWLTEALGQQVVADNRPGAGGTIGAQIAARAAPDGYTMVMGSSSTFGVTSAKRALALPGVPSMTDAGFPAVNATSWNGILVPVRTERRIVERLNREVNRMLSAAGVRERLLAQGAEPGGGSPEEFASFIRNEIAKWGKVVAAIGLRVE